MIVIAVILIIAGCFDQYGESRKSKKAALLGIIPLAVFLLSMCIVYVPSNNVGIRWSAVGGTSDKTLNEGIAIKSPIDKVFLIPTTVEERTIKKVNVQTKDAQFVTSEVNVKFRVNQKDAQTKVINAKAEADANKILEKQLTNKILAQQWIKKWNGEVPKVSGDNKSMINIGELMK